MSTTSWTPNDYSNIVTIGGATVGSVMLILFKSRCKKIKLCCGAVECVREPPPVEEDPEDPPDVPDH